MIHATASNRFLHRITAVGVALILLSCGSASVGGEPPVRLYRGLCDASAAVWLDAHTFAVADDEDNILRVYASSGSDLPLRSFDFSAFLHVDPAEPEADIEGAAQVGGLTFWITSHGRNANGKERTSRHRLFATSLAVQNGSILIEPAGLPYTRLLQDLTADPRLQRYNLSAASKLPPKEAGALNIEGLAATPGGHLLIGFRNPIPQGRALLVPLLNPSEIMLGAPAKLGEPELLNLDGRGIRSITEWGERYLIVAGSHGADGASPIYLWTGPGREPRPFAPAAFNGLNPEALAFSPGTNRQDLLVLSDDGTVSMGNRPCKKLKDPLQKQFRAIFLPEVPWSQNQAGTQIGIN